MILGARSRRETVRATDEIEDDAIRTVKMQIGGWIVVDIKDVFDLKAGTFNEEWMKKSVRDREGNDDFLGFLRIRWISTVLVLWLCFTQEKVAVGYPALKSGSIYYEGLVWQLCEW